MALFNFIRDNLNDRQTKNLLEYYRDKKVVVTGGLSFIGSHLVDCLVSLGCKVIVVDDLSSGKLSNLDTSSHAKIVKLDLRNPVGFEEIIAGSDIVFHLAAIHGGRGFIETYQKQMLANLAIDNYVFSAAVAQEVRTIVHASSACAYPVNLQISETKLNLLSEVQGSMERSDACFADGVYGWTKLIGEYQLENQVTGTETLGRSARIFTAYGDRENESHAAIALIAKGLLRADPYPIWGTGQQTRNFTYVSDTVTGLLFLGYDQRRIEFDVFNIGTDKHVTVLEFVNQIFSLTNWKPKELNFQLDKPVGVSSRASDNTKIREIFDWEPSVPIVVGLEKTIEWYKSSGLLPRTLSELEKRLIVR